MPFGQLSNFNINVNYLMLLAVLIFILCFVASRSGGEIEDWGLSKTTGYYSRVNLLLLYRIVSYGVHNKNIGLCVCVFIRTRARIHNFDFYRKASSPDWLVRALLRIKFCFCVLQVLPNKSVKILRYVSEVLTIYLKFAFLAVFLFYFIKWYIWYFEPKDSALD